MYRSASILLLIVILGGCSATRYLNDDEALVKKVTLNGIDAEFKDPAYQYVQQEIRPNSWFNLRLYNTFNTRNGKYRKDKIRNIGEAPHLLDSSLVDISRREIEKFLAYKSFFKASVKSDIQVKNKKAYISFTATQGPSFKIRNLSHDIHDTAVRKIYEDNIKSFSRLSGGRRYDIDSVMFDINKVYSLMQQNGYYDFVKKYIHVDADSNLLSSQVDLKLKVYNPPGKQFHQKYTISDSISVRIRNSSDRIERIVPDRGVVDSQYYFSDYSHRFKFKPISRYIFIKKDSLYNVVKENITYDRMYELNAFRNVKIDYKKAADSSSLNVFINAVPLKRMANRIEGEYTFNSGRNGFTIGNTYVNRNVFGGAEQLEVKLRYGTLFDSRGKHRIFSKVFNEDVQLGVNLVIPRLLVPFNVASKIDKGVPHTTLSSSLQFFNQPGAFKNRLFINSISYDWLQSRYKLHALTPINIEFRDGRLNDVLKDSLEKNGNLLYVRTNHRRYLNMGSQYSFTFNAPRLNSYNNFAYFRGLFDIGGNFLGAVSRIFNFEQDSKGARTIFGLPYLQYVKSEIDYRLYRNFGGERQLVGRINPGFILPYGNTRELPFERNFYAGGSSGVRAWQARTLGPGSYNRYSISDPETRKNLTYLDQFGELKFEGNLEYRFKLANKFLGAKLKGAAFTDFGNVWRLRKVNEVPDGEFRFNNFISQFAVGSGVGLRFDLQYFVFRFDVGAKLRDPQFKGSDKWVIRYLFNSSELTEFKKNYEITNYPDKYRLLQYNFGIGMPF